MGNSFILPAPGQPKEGPDPNFVSASQPRVTGFRFHDLNPTAPAYVRADNVLQVTLLSSIVANVRVTGRIILADGSVSGFSQDYVTNGTRAPQLQFIQMYEGYLQSVNVIVLSGAGSPRRGQLAVEVAIAAGSAVFALKEWTLLADYLASGNSLSWPGSRIGQNVESAGFLRTIQQANPAAGADFFFTIPTGARHRLMTFNAQLTASATVANRIASIIITDGANQIFQNSATVNITANQIAQITGCALASFQGVQTNAVLIGTPPNITLFQGWVIRSSVTGLQAGDQFSNIWFAMEEWIEL